MNGEGCKSKSRLKLVDQVGGATRAVALAGDILLAGVGFRVVALRISNRGCPTIVGQSSPLTGIVERIVLGGGRAYVDAGYSIHILDVSDPTHPVLLGEVPQEYAPGEYLEYYPVYAEAGGHLFVVGEAGLLVFDVRNPATPRFTGGHPVVKRSEGDRRRHLDFHDLTSVGDLAYAATDSGLAILDLGNPSQPALVAHCRVADRGNSVAVALPYAYLRTEAGLYRIDVSDPTRPRPAGFFGSASPIYAAALAGQTACAVAGANGVYAIDLADPKRLGAISHCAGLHWGSDVVVRGNRAYVADDEGGLSIFDLSDPARLRPVGCDLTVPDVSGVAVEGRHVFVLDGRGYLLEGPETTFVKEGHFLKGKVGGLRSLDLEARPVPALLGWAQLGGRGRHVIVQGSTAYVTSDNEVSLVDLADPVHPKRIGPIAGLNPDGLIAPAGKLLYVASGERLSVMAVSKGRTAREVARCEIEGGIRDFAVAAGVGYVATWNGLHTVDLGTPRRPALLGHYATREGVDCLAVDGSLAYLCVGNHLRVVDVSDPGKPSPLGSVRTGCCGDFKKVIVAGTLAYVVAWDNVSVVDVSEPAHPVELAAHGLDDRDGWAQAAVLAGDRLYVACGNNGLLVFQLGGSTPAVSGPPREEESDATANTSPSRFQHME